MVCDLGVCSRMCKLTFAMRSSPRPTILRRFCTLILLAALVSLPIPSFASAYNGHPKLVVVIVIDQFRGDYLERYRDQFGDSGFRLFLDHGAYFPNCNYNYANTRTAPGHATLFTGAYSNGHGIAANEWWDQKKKKMVTSVEDDATKLVGISGDKPGASPHNLLADTIGDELKLATQGKSRVFGLSLKDRASVLPAGFAGDAAYWIDAAAARGSLPPTIATTFPSGCRISIPPAPKNTGIENGKTRKEPSSAPPRTAKAKTAPKPASTKSSDRPASPTNTNSSSPKN